MIVNNVVYSIGGGSTQTLQKQWLQTGTQLHGTCCTRYNYNQKSIQTEPLPLKINTNQTYASFMLMLLV